MHTRRVFIAPEEMRGETLRLRGDEAHYLLDVLRLRAGDQVDAFDGSGGSCTAAVAKTARNAADLTVLERRQRERPGRGFAIAQATLKAAATDMVVQRCTELGAGALLIFDAERSIPRRGGDSTGGARAARWRRIAIEACRQCRRDFLPAIAAISGLPVLLGSLDQFDAVFLGSLDQQSRPLMELLHAEHLRPCRQFLFIVGPEGDFSPQEISQLLTNGAIPCALADAILRADTAAVAGAALLHQHLMAPRASNTA